MEQTRTDIRDLLADGEPPAVVVVSAPNCSHCGAIAPVLRAAASRHAGSVQQFEVSAPDAPDLVAELGVRGTPTVLAFRDGEEVARQVGARSPQDVERIFQAASGASTRKRSVARTDRRIRIATGAVLAVAGAVAGGSWLVAVGGAFLLAGWYDLLSSRHRRPTKTGPPIGKSSGAQ